MKARLLAGSLIVVLGSAGCFPGYKSEIVTGEPTTEFVGTGKKEATAKTEVNLDGKIVNVKVWNDFTCYGNNVTTTPQKRVYKLDGVSPTVGIAVGVASAVLFAASFASGICDPDDPRLFDFDKETPGGGISTSQASCDFISAGGTMLGFAGTLAYGATSVKALVRGPEEEELAPDQQSEPATQACGSEPVTATPLLIYLPAEDSLAYAWPDSEGKASFDLTSLIDPTVASGKALVAFATAPNSPFHTLEADQLASLRPPTWSPVPKGEVPITGEAEVISSSYELTDVDENIRRFTVTIKVKNPKTDPVSLRAQLLSDHPGVKNRSILWEDLAPGAEEEKTLSIDLPKLLPDPSKVMVALATKTGTLAVKLFDAKTGPEKPAEPAPAEPAPAGQGTTKGGKK